MTRFAIIATLTVFTALSVGTPPVVPTARAADAPASTRPADAIATSDLLIVAVPDFTAPGVTYLKPVRVNDAGEVPLPLLPGGIKVVGMTLGEAEQAIGKRIHDERLVANPRVAIDRMERGESASIKSGPIAPGDVVRFSVWDLSAPGVEEVRNLHVSEAGNIGLPMLGQTKVAGMTELEAEAAVSREYREQHMLLNAIVSVLRIKPPPAPEPIPRSVTPLPPSGRK